MGNLTISRYTAFAGVDVYTMNRMEERGSRPRGTNRVHTLVFLCGGCWSAVGAVPVKNGRP